MAFVGQSLSSGYVRPFREAIYTATAATIGSYVRLVNESATSQSVSVYLRRSGSDAVLQSRNSTLAQYAALEPLSDNQEIVLSAGDSIEAITDDERAVNYFIGGAVFQ